MSDLSPLEQYITQMLAKHNLTAGAVSLMPEVVAAEPPAMSATALGPQLWRELFLQVFTPSELMSWKSRIPRYGCSCSSFYGNWEKSNPPTFPLTFSWKYRLKAAVNEKLKQPQLTEEQAREYWRSQGLLDSTI
jgi:hypothetical protein